METVPDVVKLSDDTADNHKTDKAAVNDFLFERNFLACEEKNSEYKRKCTAGNVRQCVSLFNCRSGKCDEIGKNLSDCLKHTHKVICRTYIDCKGCRESCPRCVCVLQTEECRQQEKRSKSDCNQ